MTATFGKLQGNTLELSPWSQYFGSPNETGKSTWCAFLLSMLYGINSRERDRAGFIADQKPLCPLERKRHVRPFGMPGRQSGSHAPADNPPRQCAARRISGHLYRNRRSRPRPDRPHLRRAFAGCQREVYERSAFIRQSGLAISQDAGLERRIASLITSGEEDTSFSEATDALKKQLNRRRHNKTGQIPTLETELAETQKQIEDARALEQALKQALPRQTP